MGSIPTGPLPAGSWSSGMILALGTPFALLTFIAPQFLTLITLCQAVSEKQVVSL